MDLDIYWIGLLVLIPLVAIVAGHKTILSWLRRTSAEKREPNPLDDDAREFQRTFLRVYLLVIGSEWLQNPFMYSLFRNEKTLDEGTVSTLYISTYVSAAASAFFTGYLTDRFGRRRACLVFCGIHSLAAVSVCFDALPVLIAGRVLGGVALSLLWTAFESWMIAEYNERGFARGSGLSLTSLFGAMTTSKCLTAIVAGALDLCAAILMIHTWKENWGVNSVVDADTDSYKAAEAQKKPPPDQERTSLWDPRLWAMSFVTCCFEGTIFLFMFFWPETLQDARDRARPGVNETIPHGVIFASFMAIMVIGALSFNLMVADPDSSHHRSSIRHTLTPTLLLRGALLASAICFVAAAFFRGEIALFISFLLLEVCNGIYVPSVACHRGAIVTDEARARVYSLMNIPLFVFVVVALRMANGSGDDTGGRWQFVFIFCAALLLAAVLVAAMYLHVDNRGPEGFSAIPSQDLAGIDSTAHFLSVEAIRAELDPVIEEYV
ncbi:major facilitator superfamily domain-containing protein [Xylaria acuta]|nr:major facilitator superfamily domain-containing protein [Xylaria acuta]